MEYSDVINELLTWKKDSLCDIVEVLMEKGRIDITDINLCHVRALESKMAEKDAIIHEADNCIFESMFTDSIGKPADNQAMMRKLKWLDKVGTHNIDGIMEYLKKDCKTIQAIEKNGLSKLMED